MDKRDADSRPITDSTVNRHEPVRHVISVNGEEEDVENINIHDFTTFEQEQLIGPEFIGRLKRKSVDDDSGKTPSALPRSLSSFRSAARAVLSTEVILQAMRHYNHRSDSETEEDEDDSRTPRPTETGSVELCSANNPEPLRTDSCDSGNPVSLMSVQNAEAPNTKPSEADSVVNSSGVPSSVEKYDRFTSATVDSSASRDSALELSAVHVVDAESASAADVKSGDTELTPAATSVVSPCEMRVDASLGSAVLPSSDTVAVSASDSSAVNLSQRQEVAVTVAAGDSSNAETAKRTDGLVTPTAEQRQTKTTDTGCRCCSVQ